MTTGLQYAYPERMLKRARFIHLTLPGGAWSLCNRARIGNLLLDDKVPDGWEICPRCLTRQKYLSRGVAFRRHRPH